MKNNKIRTGIIVLILLINTITFTNFFINRKDYSYYVNDFGRNIKAATVTFSDDSIVEFKGTRKDGDYYVLDFHALKKGQTNVIITFDSNDKLTAYSAFEVNSIGTLSRVFSYDFNQWHILLIGFMISFFLLSILLFNDFFIRIKNDLYSYKTLQSGGIFLFCLFSFLCTGILSAVVLYNFHDYSASMIFTVLQIIFIVFLVCTIPFVVGFGIALSLSNLMLIRKEGFRFVNLLGILLSATILAAVFCAFYIPSITPSFTEFFDHVLSRLQYATIGLLCFALSFMLSTMICALIAAKRVPAFDKDYIIILGCSIKQDGTLFPLLQGRVDRAIWFWEKQLEKTGKKAIFIPSGGKGDDEPISEGEAMERYLLSKGIPAECILPEMQSKTTLENIQFSKKLIDAQKEDAKIVFSTTNYHVFRGGMLASKAGVKADGIGSRTKWYFWPNAFVREFIGLLYSAKKSVLLLFGTIALLFGIFSFII